MEAKDLMIGDWVYDTILQGYTRVKVLTARGVKGDIHDNIWDEDSFAPIPLTPEILEKNGFEYEKNHDVWILEYGEIIIEVGIYHPDFINVGYKQITPDGTNEGNISSICKVDGSDIMTHELQHALRLCQIEKEIEL